MALPQTVNLTADGNYDVSGRLSGKNSLPGTFAVWGTWDGATVKLQAGFSGPDNVVNWFDVPEASFTADGLINFAFKCNQLRVVVSGAGAGTDVNYWVG